MLKGYTTSFAFARIMLFALCAGFAGHSVAQTLIVDNMDDSGPGSLRDQVAAASSGSTIVFDGSLAGSIISLTSGEIVIDKDLTIDGLGAGSLAISGNNNSRIFRVTNGNTVSIGNLALVDGLAGGSNPQGGAIRNSGDLTLSDCRVSGNSVPAGAESRIGGGIANAAGDGNRARLVIERCEITNNTSAGEGGGIGNASYRSGAAAELIVRDSTISGNSANYGGGIATYAQFDGSVQTRIENSTISGNSASNDGGGLDVDVLNDGFLAQLIFVHSTIHGNDAAGNGGGLSFFNDNTLVVVRNSLIAGNVASGSGNELYRGSVGAGLALEGGNLLGSDSGAGTYSFTQSDLIGTAADPIDPLLGPLQDNGGLTQTHRPQVGSPAVELATDLHCFPTDQRGSARPYDGDNDGTARCDSGAVELVVDLYHIGGTVSGLEGSGLVLQNNGGDDLTIASDGSFVFATSLQDGTAYEVTVATQPSDPDQTCTVVANGSGTVLGGDVTDVVVDCVTEQYAVGGTVSSLEGSGLVLQNNGGDDLAVAADGPFQFSQPLDDGSSYSVTVAAQPRDPAQKCTVSNDSGTLSGGDADNVWVLCETLDSIIFQDDFGLD